jgi:hypothetical protein
MSSYVEYDGKDAMKGDRDRERGVKKGRGRQEGREREKFTLLPSSLALSLPLSLPASLPLSLSISLFLSSLSLSLFLSQSQTLCSFKSAKDRNKYYTVQMFFSIFNIYKHYLTSFIG